MSFVPEVGRVSLGFLPLQFLSKMSAIKERNYEGNDNFTRALKPQ